MEGFRNLSPVHGKPVAKDKIQLWIPMQTKALRMPQAGDTMHRCMWVRKTVQNASAAGAWGHFHNWTWESTEEPENTYSPMSREQWWISWGTDSEHVEKKGVEIAPSHLWVQRVSNLLVRKNLWWNCSVLLLSILWIMYVFMLLIKYTWFGIFSAYFD